VVGSVNQGAKKIFEEIMEEPSLCLVGEDHIAILILKVFDLILAKVARSTKVEIPGVFVAQDAVFDLGTLRRPSRAERRRCSSRRSKREMTARKFRR
jgi:hypothetical protein